MCDEDEQRQQQEVIVRTCAAALQPMLEHLASAFHTREYLMALQHYDLLLASPSLEHLACVARQHADALDAYSRTYARATSVPYATRTHVMTTTAATTTTTTATATASATTTTAPASASTSTSSSHNNGDNDDEDDDENELDDEEQAAANAAIEADAAAAQQQLLQSSPLLRALHDSRQAVERAWGSAVLAAVERMPDEHEHSAEMVEDYERLFACTSPYLQALSLPSTSALDLVMHYDNNDHEGGALRVSADVVLAAVTRHFAKSSSRQLARLVRCVRRRGVRLTTPVAELLERSFVRCMKDEDVEDVFATMTRAGLAPRTTRPFAMLFNAHACRYVSSVLDYYELMLDYGIAPEPSIWRILCKQCATTHTARLHFTLRQRSTSHHHHSNINNNNNNKNSSNNNAAQGDAATAVVALPESRRRDERMYFDDRLYDLARHVPTPPLLEAMKCVHRADVEGTSLSGDTHLLISLLRYFCNGLTPRHDLVEPFAASAACKPARVRLVVRVAADGTVAHAMSSAASSHSTSQQPSQQPSHGNDSGVDAAADEQQQQQQHNKSSGGDGGADDGAVTTTTTTHDDSTTSQQQPPLRYCPHLPPRYVPADELASPGEEAAYVLRVLAQYGSVPNNRVLTDLVLHYESKGGGIGILEQVTQAMFALTKTTRGAAEPVRCFRCHILIHYYIRRRMRHRIVQLLRAFSMQYYEYAVLWQPDTFSSSSNNNNATTAGIDKDQGHGSDDATTVQPSTSSHNNNNNNKNVSVALVDRWDEDYVRNFMSFATAAMKTGPLDWALGLFTLALIVSTRPVVLASTRVCLLRFHEADYRRSPHYAVLSALEQCEWHRTAILRCDELMLEPHEQAAAAAAAAESSRDEAAEHCSDIYTSAAHEHSSYANPRGADAHPTLCSYLCIALREMGLERDVVDWYKQRLREQRNEVLAR